MAKGASAMAKAAAPSMPTERQVSEAYKLVSRLCPGARVKSIGPEGVQFEYPSAERTGSLTPLEEWKAQNGKP